jgi:hypothetical protein
VIDAVLLMATNDRPAHGCAPGTCPYTTQRVRAFVIAYREATKHGDDPAEYIRDSIKSSRPSCPPCHKPDPIEPAIRGKRREPDDDWHILTKLALEEARAAGISLDTWNADRLAAWLCERDA